MKKNIYLITGFVLILCFFTSFSIFAAEKIGFINLRAIIQTSNNGKKAAEDLKKLVDKKSEAIKAVETELKKMKESIDKQSAVLTDSVKKEKETAYQKKMRDYQILVDDSNKELKAKDEEIAGKLIPDIMKVVRIIGEREKYTLILEISSMPVPYFANENDISKKVIDEYNKQKK
jgi:outer membrane protein